MLEFTLKSQEYDGRYMEVHCLQRPNVAENTSEIEWTLTVLGGDAPGYSTGPTTLSIGGITVYECPRKSYSSKVFPATKGAVSGTMTVIHGLTGLATLSVCLTTAIYTQTLTETAADWQLEPIERRTEIRASDALIGSCATVVVNRKSELFTHSIAYFFEGRSGWLTEKGEPVNVPVKFRKSIVNFLLPESFYEAMPTKKRARCQLTCTTWRGNQSLGETVCSFWAAADPELCRPVVSGKVIPKDALTLTLTGGPLIPGVSTALCRVEAAAQKGARLVSLTAGEVPVEENQAVLIGWSLPQVPVVAVDSRGFETKISLPSPCIPYVQLTNLAEVARPEPTADSGVLTLRGVCFPGNFGNADNSLTATVEFDGRSLTVPVEMGDGEYLATVALPELAYTRSYPVTVTVADRAMAVTLQLILHKGVPVFAWGEGDFRFYVPVEVPALTIGGVPLERYLQQTASPPAE